MKWQDVQGFVIASGAAGTFFLISMILNLTGVTYDYTNWEQCRGGTDCYARFDIDTTYWRICLEVDDEYIGDPFFFKKSSRGRTLWIHTNRKAFITTNVPIETELLVGTLKSRAIDFAPDGKPLRQIKTGDCIERGKTNFLYVKAIKPEFESVVWKMNLFGIDPVWQTRIVKDDGADTQTINGSTTCSNTDRLTKCGGWFNASGPNPDPSNFSRYSVDEKKDGILSMQLNGRKEAPRGANQTIAVNFNFALVGNATVSGWVFNDAIDQNGSAFCRLGAKRGLSGLETNLTGIQFSNSSSFYQVRLIDGTIKDTPIGKVPGWMDFRIVYNNSIVRYFINDTFVVNDTGLTTAQRRINTVQLEAGSNKLCYFDTVNVSRHVEGFEQRLHPAISELKWEADWSSIDFSTLITNVTLISGNYTINLTDYNITPENFTNQYVFALVNGFTRDIAVQVSVNSSETWLQQHCTLGGDKTFNITTALLNVTNITSINNAFLNCTIDLINISQTYVNWSLQTDTAFWAFRFIFNHSFI